MKNLTLEEIHEKRKNSHLLMTKNLEAEARVKLNSLAENEKSVFRQAGIVVDSFFSQMESYESLCLTRSAGWYNSDINFRTAVNEALDLKVGIEAKFSSLRELMAGVENGSRRNLEPVRVGYEAALCERILKTEVSEFCKPGIMYRLRSDTQDIPWDALAEGKMQELIVPSTISSQQAEILWDCLLRVADHMKSIKIMAGDTYCTISLSSLLEQPKQAMNGYAIGTDGLKVLIPVLSFNPQITELDLGNCKIRDDGVAHLLPILEDRGKDLQSLVLLNNHVTDVGMQQLSAALCHHSSLTYLHLGYNNISDQSGPALGQILSHHTSIATLDLTYLKLGAEGIGTMGPGIACLTDLTTLDLSAVPMGSRGMKALAQCLRDCKKLRRFTTTFGRLGEEGSHHLREIVASHPEISFCPLVGWGCSDEGYLSVIQALGPQKFFIMKDRQRISHEILSSIVTQMFSNGGLETVVFGEWEGMSAEGVACVFELASLSSVKSFTMSDIDLTDTILHRKFNDIKLSKSLTKICVTDCSIGDLGVATLAKVISAVNDLKFIDLRGNMLSAEGIIPLSTILESNQGLEHLELCHNSIQSTGIKLLCQTLAGNNMHLAFLGLSFNGISHGIIHLTKVLEKVLSLRRLNISGNPIGTSGSTWLIQVAEYLARLEHFNIEASGISPIFVRRVCDQFDGSVKVVSA